MKLFDQYNSSHVLNWNMEDLAGAILWKYLFDAQGVKAIEEDLFGIQINNGFTAKGILNLYGVDTSTESSNRGIYHEESPREVIEFLLSSQDPISQNVAMALLQYRLKNRQSKGQQKKRKSE